MDFQDRNVLATGASRGIGRAVAQRFAEKGARVAVHYNRNKALAEETLGLLLGEGHDIVQADVSDPADVKRMVDAVIDGFSRIDVLVNNAGIFYEHPVPDVNYDQWQKAWMETIGSNLIGQANVSYLVARHMIEQGGGKIVNITSRGAFRGEPDAPAYGASKAGMNAMSQSMAKALAPHGIFVYAVAPGWVDTDMAADVLNSPDREAVLNQSPIGRVAKPEEIAHMVLCLASEGSEFATGCIVDVNGASYLRT